MSKTSRQRGNIEQRGPNNFRVRVYVGKDPVTNKDVYLKSAEPDRKAAERKRTEFLRKVDEGKAAKTAVRFAYVVDQWMDSRLPELAPGTISSYRQQIRDYIKPEFGDMTLPEIENILVQRAEKMYAELAKCSRRCRGQEFVEHRQQGQANNAPVDDDLTEHRCWRGCRPHRCVPLSIPSIRQIHTIITGACAAAERWNWLSPNPAKRIVQPKRPKPKPQAPSVEEMAALVGEAFNQDVEWGTSIWILAMTGSRRGEHVSLQVRDFNFEESLVLVKDTKTGTERWIRLDLVTMQLVAEQIERIRYRKAQLGLSLTGAEYLYSYVMDHSTPGSLSYFTHRFIDMARSIGLSASPHKIRHFSATELLHARIALPNVAGRLGHGSGGQTTLKYYAAYRRETDHTAVSVLANRMPELPQIRHTRAIRDFASEQPSRTTSEVEERICELRRGGNLGPKRIKTRLAREDIDIAESTIWLVLKRHGLNRIS